MARLLNTVLQAIAGGLFVALLAPAVAALVFALVMASTTAMLSEIHDPGVFDLLLLALGFATGAYLLGLLPSFAAGLALPALLRRLSPVQASIATGLLGTAVYVLGFGAPWGADPLRDALYQALPAFVGVSVAAFVFTRRRRRRGGALETGATAGCRG